MEELEKPINLAKEYLIVDGTSGEILSTLRPDEMPKRKVDKKNRKIDPKLRTLIFHNLGNFYHLFYDNLPYGLSRAMKFRFMFLCTYVNLQGYLAEEETDHKFTKADIKRLLGLGDAQFYETYNTFLKKGMLSEDKNGIKASKSLCVNGKVHKFTCTYTRTFNESVRELYTEHTAYEHERLGILLDLLKHIHVQTNELCFNPTEEDLTKIQPMSRRDILKELNISDKVFTEFKKLKINKDSEYIMISIGNNQIYTYVLNPKISYKGSSIPVLEKLIKPYYFLVKSITRKPITTPKRKRR